ncbi:MAG: NAD(P)/FAD-dependent oxidoreductase, partial [Eubacterium sp.]|nr:NAD(P)/FAD-dependent oxidoreductase [Eubacterium sp.]
MDNPIYERDYGLKKDMIIVGAGAAGMMAAIHASAHFNVIVIEKNEKPGKKLFITGKGRCNVTNSSDADTFLKNVVTNSRFLYSAISSYDQDKVITYQFFNFCIITNLNPFLPH